MMRRRRQWTWRNFRTPPLAPAPERAYASAMPVRYWFKCDICGCLPDDATRNAIGASTREDLFGELIDAMPGKWLVWHAGGLLGPRRYACPDHRKMLLKKIRFHYAYSGEQWVWKRPPYPQRWPPDGITDAPDGTLTIPEWFVPGPGSPGDQPAEDPDASQS
jgi:hypothetical protein